MTQTNQYRILTNLQRQQPLPPTQEVRIRTTRNELPWLSHMQRQTLHQPQ